MRIPNVHMNTERLRFALARGADFQALTYKPVDPQGDTLTYVWHTIDRGDAAHLLYSHMPVTPVRICDYAEDHMYGPLTHSLIYAAATNAFNSGWTVLSKAMNGAAEGIEEWLKVYETEYEGADDKDQRMFLLFLAEFLADAGL